MAGFLFSAATVVLLTVMIGLLRAFYGPAEADRLMSAQLIGSGGVAVLLLLSVAMKVPAIVDVALMLALLATCASITFVNKSTDSADPLQSSKAERT
jgi:multicomponent Na+:H+ antiporter subunit F